MILFHHYHEYDNKIAISVIFIYLKNSYHEIVILNIFSIGLGVPQPHVDITVKVVGVLLFIFEMSTEDRVLDNIYKPSLSNVLSPVTLQHMAREWLKEDTPNFDYGGFVVGEKEETALLLIKSPGVLAGKPFFEAIFKELDCVVSWEYDEGEFLEPIQCVAKVTGKVRQLLLGERVALNCLSRASGIASLARQLAKIKERVGWKGEIAGTRKTTPGFRLVEKYALMVGSVSTHRHDLSSMIMLKDNHIWTSGSITQVLLPCTHNYIHIYLALNPF